MIHGLLLFGRDQVTPICLPRGRFRSITLFTDNHLERLFEPVELRVAVFHWEDGWKVLPPIYLDGPKGPVEIWFEEPEDIGGVSIQRRGNSNATVAWTVL